MINVSSSGDAQRAERIGGTTVSAIMGRNPWQTREKALQYHLNPAPLKDNRYMEWGRRLEGPVAEAYADKNDVTLIDLVEEEANGLLCGHTIRHPEVPYLIGSPDRLVLKPGLTRYKVTEKISDDLMKIGGGIAYGLEIKTSSAWKAKDWNDTIPEHYLIQAQFYMMVTGLDRWDFAVLIGGNGYRDPWHNGDEKGEYSHFSVKADLMLHQDMIDAAADFWEEVQSERGRRK